MSAEEGAPEAPINQEKPPQQRLKEFIGDESAGSLRIMAAGNLAALRRARAILDTHIAQPTSPIYIETAAERAAIVETERQQLLGPHSAQYKDAQRGAGEVFDTYFETHKVEVPIDGQPETLGVHRPATNIAAAEAFLTDLYGINDEKSNQPSS